MDNQPILYNALFIPEDATAILLGSRQCLLYTINEEINHRFFFDGIYDVLCNWEH